MRQLIQSYKTGELGIYDLPRPYLKPQGVLVQSVCSLVSAGTEKMIVELAKKSLIGKAIARPDLVEQVVGKIRQEGLKNTLDKVFSKLDTPIPLGYSLAGEVVEVGVKVSGISVGDRVACGGAGYASHGEYNYVPRNLFVKIPDGLDDLSASFVTVGSIALNGVRQAETVIGEMIGVIGLGLIGQLTVQLLKASGCKVLGMDIDQTKLILARKLGADMAVDAADIRNAALGFSGGRGLDAVIVTASSSSNQPVIDAGEIARMRGRVVVVGMVGMDIPRNIYYKKELEIKLSMAYGPGRYDPQYEEQGQDYPYPFVRWTEQRNFESFLALAAEGKVTPHALVTHQFSFDQATKAYDLLEGRTGEAFLGIVLNYPKTEKPDDRHTIVVSRKAIKQDRVNIGVIGAGNFARSVLLPTMAGIKDLTLQGICTASGISSFSSLKKFGFSFMTTSVEELLADDRIDTVVIANRHDDHARHVIAALEAGKHVFVEKPLAISFDELRQITEVYQTVKEGRILQVGFNRRFSPMIQKVGSILKGQPIALTYRINAGEIPLESWVQDSAVGGGRIVGEVCHFIDTAVFLTGSLPVSFFATCVRTENKAVPDEDNLHLVVNFENGATAAITYMAYGNKAVHKEYIEIFGPDFLAKLDDYRELDIYNGKKREKKRSLNQDKGFRREFAALVHSIKVGKPAISFEELYRTTILTLLVSESLATGKVVSLA